MTINYFLLCSGDTIIGPGSQPATETQTNSTTDPTTGEVTTTTTEVAKPLPANCIACTEAQYAAWQTLQVVDGVLQDIPKATLLLNAQNIQRATIKQSFTSAANASVTDSSGNVWEGGKDSGNEIFLGCQLAQQSGATTITLYDATKAPHSMTIAEGMAVAALIGVAYQTALGTKNSLYAQIKAATTVSAAQGVVWA